MSTRARSGLARVTVVAPHTRVDLALPHASTLAELLPTLLRITGEDVVGDGSGDAWALSRLGDAPLDTARTVESHGIRDGEVLHLHPRADQPPAPVFDDVVDAVATATGDPARRWQPRTTRLVGLVGAGLLFTAAAVVAILSGADRALAAGVAAGAAVVLLAVAFVLSRALGDSAAATAPALGAVATAAAAGFVAVHDGPVGDVGRAGLSGAAAGAALAAVLAAVLVGDFVPVFAAVAVTASASVVAALAALLVDASTAAAAAVTVTTVFALLPVLPILALRLARLPVPSMPTDAQDLQRDDDLAGPDALDRAVAADRFLTAVVAAAATVGAGAGMLLAVSGGTAARWLAACVATGLLLRARLHGSAAQRIAFTVAGTVVAAALVAVVTRDLEPAARLGAVFGGVVAAGGLVLAGAMVVPDRHHSPYWGRAADVLEIVALVAVLPLALAVAGVYSYVRGLGG